MFLLRQPTGRLERHKEGHMASSMFGVQDLLARLGAEVTRGGSSSGTALVAFREDLVLRGIGLDADRVAALGSDNPEGARKGWSKRRVNLTDADGRSTDIPRIVQIKFSGSERTQGVPDVGILANVFIEGLGHIDITPRYVLADAYIKKAKSGLYEGTRPFVGVLYEPAKQGQPYKFVQNDLLDNVFVLGWNHLVDRSKESGGKYAGFDKVVQMKDAPVGRTKRIKVAPAEKESKTFDRIVYRGGRKRTVKEKQIHYGTLFGKKVVGASRSQVIPNELILANVAAVEAGRERDQWVEVYAFEKDNSIVIFVSGDDAFLTIDEVEESTNPFDALDIPPERFFPERARQVVSEWLQRPLDERNDYYQRAITYGLVHPDQPRSTQRGTLQSFFRKQVDRAEELWTEAVNMVFDLLKDRELPSIEDCLAGNTLEQTIKLLNADDALAAWITSQLVMGSRYSHGVPFFRELRKRLLLEIAKRAKYSDPEPPKADDKPEASKAKGASESVAEPTEAPPANGKAEKPARSPRSGGRGGKGGSSKKAKGDQPAADNGAAS